ncbi:MAG TPA: TonB-dependent receptor [Burkholderiaceae bacterium]
MSLKQTQIASAVSAALLAIGAPAFAGGQAAEPQVTTVQVTGIRASLEQSLNVKRNSSANIAVVTAEDIGKMPDKNLADSLQRLPGVAVRTDYDEAEKVSMRGTNPDMSLIVFNGHSVSSGDWYVSDQLSSSRSTSLSLVPSSVLNQALVYKTSQANIMDGGLAGTVNVTTRKPLNAKERISGVVELGGVYSTLPGKVGPQASGMINWKNEANTVGALVQLFAEKRYVRRDSASRFAYGASSGWDVINTATMRGITDASLAGTPYKASDLNGVRLPGSMSTEFVEGVRDRKGGLFSLQFKPNNSLDITTTGFYSSMDANNYGRLTAGAMYSMLVGKAGLTGGIAAADPNTNSNGQQVFAQIRNPVIVNETTSFGHQLRVLKSADIVFPTGTTPQYVGNSEAFYRDGAKGMSSFVDVDVKWRANSDLTVKALLNATRGVGTTALDQGATWARYGTGVSYKLNGVEEVPSWNYIGTGPNDGTRAADGSGHTLISTGASANSAKDRETSLNLDGEYRGDWGPFTQLDFGIRVSDHKRFLERTAPALTQSTLAQPPAGGIALYPSDFGDNLNGGSFENTGFFLTPDALQAFIKTRYTWTTPEFDRRVAGEIDVREKQMAAYFMQSFEADSLSGNFGLRWTSTQNMAQIATPTSTAVCQKYGPGQTATPCVAVPGAINTAGDGSVLFTGVPFDIRRGSIYYKVPSDVTHRVFLPSLNLRWEPSKGMITRFGASKTLGRQNYNVIGAGFSGVTCPSTGCTVNGPNPRISPLTAKNADLSFAWYFAPRSVAEINFFASNIAGYAKTGANPQGLVLTLLDPVDPTLSRQVNVLTTLQQTARIRGVELSYEQPIGAGFGISGNVSRAKTEVEDGRPMTGASDISGNIGGYYENDKFSARLVWNYRGKYISSSTAPSPFANSQGLSTINGVLMPTAPTWAKGVANVALTMNYNWSNAIQFSFSATNLTDPARAQYRYSEEEQQKVDVSGRQFYLTGRYKF